MSALNPNVGALKKLWPTFQKHGVRKVWLFGSRARGDSRDDSNWDMLVDFSSPPKFGNFMGLKLDLEDHLGTKVDLLTRNACRPRFLRAIQAEMRHVA